MKLSVNSSVGAMRSIEQNNSGSDADKARVIRWCSDVQGQAITHMQRLIVDAEISRGGDSVEIDEDNHTELLAFLVGVGKIVTELANEIRDPEDLES